MSHYTQRFEQAYIEALYFTSTGPDTGISRRAKLSKEARLHRGCTHGGG